MHFLNFFRVEGFEKKSLVNFNITLDKSIANYISVVVFLVENFVGCFRKRAVYWFFHFIDCFKADTLRRSYWQILTVFIKDYSLLAVLFVECFEQGTQQKEVVLAFFVNRFKCFMTEVPILLKPTIDLQSKSMVWLLYDRDLCNERVNGAIGEDTTEKSWRYIRQYFFKLHFRSSFASRKFSAGCSTKSTGHCSFRRAL